MNRSWVRFPQAAQMRPPGNGRAFLYALTGPGCLVCPWAARPPVVLRVVACRPQVLRVPSGLAVGRGCFVCPWAVARPRDRHTRACGSERSISKPGQAPPPPTGTAARPSGSSGTLHTSGVWLLTCGLVRCLEARNFNDYMSKREVCAGECLRICAEQALPPSEQFRT